MYALGRIVQHDPRSLAFPAAQAPELRTVSHRHWGKALNQGELGSCTGNALAQALNTSPLRAGRKLLDEDDAVRLYSLASQLDDFPGGYPPEDTGSSGLAVCKAGKELGLLTRYWHAFGLQEALRALVLAPVIIGINWYDTMFMPDEDGYIWPLGELAGGHEVALIGLDVKRKRVTVLNSWGPEWGNGGKAYMKWETLDTLLQQQGDVTVPVR